MAAKRATRKRTTKRRRAVKRLARPPRMKSALRACNQGKICQYLLKSNGLLAWLDEFWEDYRKLRIAVCNVEKQAFSGMGNAAKPPRFCSGGGGNEPADPPKPPAW
jgi:hypothetical protein